MWPFMTLQTLGYWINWALFTLAWKMEPIVWTVGCPERSYRGKQMALRWVPCPAPPWWGTVEVGTGSCSVLLLSVSRYSSSVQCLHSFEKNSAFFPYMACWLQLMWDAGFKEWRSLRTGFEHAELGLLLGGDGILSCCQHRGLCWEFRELKLQQSHLYSSFCLVFFLVFFFPLRVFSVEFIL